AGRSRSSCRTRYNIPPEASAGSPTELSGPTAERKNGETERPADRKPAVLRDGPLSLQLPAGQARPLAGGDPELPDRHGDVQRARVGGRSPQRRPHPPPVLRTPPR